MQACPCCNSEIRTSEYPYVSRGSCPNCGFTAPDFCDERQDQDDVEAVWNKLAHAVRRELPYLPDLLGYGG